MVYSREKLIINGGKASPSFKLFAMGKLEENPLVLTLPLTIICL